MPTGSTRSLVHAYCVGAPSANHGRCDPEAPSGCRDLSSLQAFNCMSTIIRFLPCHFINSSYFNNCIHSNFLQEEVIRKGTGGLREVGLNQFSPCNFSIGISKFFFVCLSFLTIVSFHLFAIFLAVVLYLVIPFNYAIAGYFILTMGTLAHRMFCPKLCMPKSKRHCTLHSDLGLGRVYYLRGAR